MTAFTVHGIPAPQGSKSPWGSESNPNTRPWRATVAAAAAEQGNPVISGPVELVVRFYFPRPKGHYRTGANAHEVKPNAPQYKASKPDLDKLLRAIGDSLTGTVVRDDAQIVRTEAVKLYGQPRAEIQVIEINKAAA